MGLIKNMELDNGVVLNYHRIASINNITNVKTLISINSYISKELRQKEKEYQKIQFKNANQEKITDEEQTLLKKGINVLIESKIYSIDYSKDLNVDNAYEYLKTLPEFEGSIDD